MEDPPAVQTGPSFCGYRANIDWVRRAKFVLQSLSRQLGRLGWFFRPIYRLIAERTDDTYDMKRQAERLTAVYEQAIADKKANRFVQVDRQKPLLTGHWYELLGLEENPFHSLPRQVSNLMQRD